MKFVINETPYLLDICGFPYYVEFNTDENQINITPYDEE
jgi:hypothetical protein